MHRFTYVLAALTFSVGLTACGGGYSGFLLPIETELKPWVPPETEDLIEDESDEGDDEEYEDYEDEEEDAAPAAPAK